VHDSVANVHHGNPTGTYIDSRYKEVQTMKRQQCQWFQNPDIPGGPFFFTGKNKACPIIRLAVITALMVGFHPLGTAAQNLLTNPDFDDTQQLTGWTFGASSWDVLDWLNQGDSGSITQANSIPSPSTITIGRQCVEISDPGMAFRLSGFILNPTAQTAPAQSQLGATWFGAPGCEESSYIGGAETPSVLETDVWLESSMSLTLPPEAQSVKVSLYLYKTTGAGITQSWFDHIFFGDGPMFADGFESGDLLGWDSSEGQ
jgi:hypothetical protein